MDRSRLIPVAAVSLLLLGLAASLYRVHFPPGPVADEAGYLMLTQSLWHDHDLRYEEKDLARAYQIWDQGPYGLILLTKDNGDTLYYGKPFVYPLFALPFYGVFGAQGLIVFNMALVLAMLWTAWHLFGRQGRWHGLLVAGFVFGSAYFAYTFWLHPEVFNGVCLFFALAAWHATRKKERFEARDLLLLAGAGVLVAALFLSKEVLVLLGVPIGLDLLIGRRWKGLAAFVAAGALAGLALLAVQWRTTGTWSPYRDAQRSSFDKAFPLESSRKFFDVYPDTSFGSWSGIEVATTPKIFLRDLGYFFVGRHTGLLAYYPFALLALLSYLLGPRDRARHLLLLAIAGYSVFFLLVRPENFHGGAGFLGNRYFASIYPALLFLPVRWLTGGALVAAFAAVGLWTAPVVATPVQQVAPEFGLQVHARMPAFQALPLELTLLPWGRIPGYFLETWDDKLWVVPKQNFFPGEKNDDGVWVRGASRSEIFLVSPQPIEALDLEVGSVSGENVVTFDSGEDRVVVRMDTPGKRVGTPVHFRPELVAKDLRAFFREGEYFYRFELTVSDGVMPARRFKSLDERYLGAFLRFRPAALFDQGGGSVSAFAPPTAPR